MATQSFTVAQLDRLPQEYGYDGNNELLLLSVLSGSSVKTWKTYSTEVRSLSSYYVTKTEWEKSREEAGEVVAYGTYYLNGDTRERIYSLPTALADPIRGTLETDDKNISYDKYLHSGNIAVDDKYNKIYFCRGTWPRLQGTSSTDKDGWTWRELGGQGEAICRVNLDGTDFEVVKDLSNLGAEYYDPSAVAFDDVHDYVFFACRNDHNKSRIYRMDRDGSNLVLWVEMTTGDVNIDCLDIAHIPQDFFAPNNPSCTTTYLYFGISPDYDKNTDTAKQAQSAILRVPVIGTAPGTLASNWSGKYCVHRFWHSGYQDSEESSGAVPDMATTGVKGIKVFISNILTNDAKPNWLSQDAYDIRTYGYGSFGRPGNVDKRWTPSMSIDAVARDRSRIYVVHSGARNVKRSQVEVTVHGTGATPPAAPPIPDTPSIHEVEPTYSGHGYGGNSVLELLIGEPPGGPGEFSVQDDANRPYKSWLEGTLYISGNTKVIDMGQYDPGQALSVITDATGSARNQPWAIGDYLYVLNSPSNTSIGAGLLDDKSGRGVRKIIAATAGNYSLDNTDGTQDGQGEVGTVMVIPVIMSTLADVSETANHGIYNGIRTSSLFGLRDITVNPCTMEVFVSDFWSSSYYLRNIAVQTPGAGAQPAQPADPDIPFQPADPPNPPIPGNPPNPAIPGNQPIPGRDPIPAGPYNPFIPGYPPIPGNPPIPSIPGNQPVPGNPGDPAVPFQAGDPFVPAVPAGVGVSYRTTQPDDSYYGTIYRGDAFYYCRYRNGEHLFNRFSHIGYNRPCGLGGYLVGPHNEYRLVYTNGETQLLTPTSLLTDINEEVLAARGKEINGLSQVFTRHGVLAAGKNIYSIFDFGFGAFNGLLVTLDKKSTTSDYAVLTQSSNGDTLTVPTLHHQDPVANNNVANQEGPNAKPSLGTLQYLVDDPSLYQAKNTKQFRICYPDNITGMNSWTAPKTVNTVFFTVIQ